MAKLHHRSNNFTLTAPPSTRGASVLLSIRFDTKVLRLSGALSAFFCLISAFSFAQLREYPLGTTALATPGNGFKTARTQALALPFFDDFSLTVNGLPDPTLWQTGGGVVVNNTLAINQPSVNVATLDGLGRNRVPYDFANELSKGRVDTLTSQGIDLSALSAPDSVYLSFFWQARGLGELPDREDSLQLEFRTATGAWQVIWKQVGQVLSNQFTQVLIPVKATVYFHANFQFRFQAFGRQSGAFDTWHLDYIYLNKSRRATDRFYKDVAVRRQPTSYLRRYTAMPLKHYLRNPAAETTDSLRTDIVNLFNNNNFTTLRLSVREVTTGQTLQQYTQPVSENIGVGASQVKSVKPTPLTAFAGPRAVIRYTFDLLTTDDQNPSIPGVNLKRNDTLSGQTVLDTYFAYDDGTAEYAADVNQRLGRVAVRFIGTQPDVVSAVRMHVVQYRKNLTGQNFTIQILADENGKPGRTLGQQGYTVNYSAEPNGFVELALKNPVAVRDTFYVAWIQLSEDALPVGLDKNTNFGKEIFYNLGSEWIPNTTLQGSFMVRAVTGGQANTVVTGTETEPTAGDVTVFPNPTRGPIEWNDDRFRRLEIMNIAGQTVRQLDIRGQRGTDLSDLPAGIYVLKLADDWRSYRKRVVITH
ncbi:MAG: T9SS type A sorting domain-containing protein [Cytophagaceae bacterium]|nr:T9SS type A sorting domain-containing protein [Cytophagaceae bacterium]